MTTAVSPVSPPLSFAVMGAGAVGSYFGALLARAGHAVTLIGRPAHVQAIADQGGLQVESAAFTGTVPLRADTAPSAVAGADVVLFSVKSTDTEAAAAQIAPHLRPGALVLTLQNGVDNDARVRDVLGAAHTVAAAVVYVATSLPAPGRVRHHGRGELVIGPPSAAAQKAARQLGAAGIPSEVVPDVRGALWAKLVVNCAYNALSALTRLSYGPLAQGHAAVPAVLDGIVDECLAVARADGVQVPGDVRANVRAIAGTMAGQHSSTAQDLARGRPTEIDHLNGYVVRRGEALGVPVPVNRLLWVAVKLVEGAPASRG
ncbi:ketopantoate reductase family protein [Xylophilus sp.]|uniref:ketopantoate reductase family protein n=1 Tax=Xylophilus sp. TaxID=2653893 RepID=UPI0013BBA7C4|nr:ketopantoate reductase family protein [Xylophilus sp.]KAF1050196.1 MAG: 2-dehydropantoate 2-reductase [Xylophilus sp.]